jgi:hypothetical protein
MFLHRKPITASLLPQPISVLADLVLALPPQPIRLRA